MALYGPVRHQQNIIWTEASVIEGYISMINSTDKISTRVSCSMWSFLSCLVNATELRHKLVCLFDVSR